MLCCRKMNNIAICVRNGQLYLRRNFRQYRQNGSAADRLREKPAAQTETLDPLLLGAKMVDPDCRCGCCCDLNEVPESLGCMFGDDIILDSNVRKLYVTLGQFSIIRLERDIQLLMPAYDICMPTKECTCSEGSSGCEQEDPCTVFERFDFPVDEFFPPKKERSDSCSCQNDSRSECRADSRPECRPEPREGRGRRC